MTIIDSHRVFIGACGWLHEAWQEQFYPQDLPGEWQLAYYGNEFPLVMVRQQEWRNGGEVAEWLDETDETPLFICELPLQLLEGDLLAAAEPYLDNIRQLAGRCLGIVCHAPTHVDTEAFAAVINKCKQLAPTCVEIEGTGNEALQQLLASLAVNQVWKQPEHTEQVNGPLVVARINCQAVNLKELRRVMESLLHYDDKQHTLVLLLDGEPPDLEMIKQAKMMLELM
ncbi:MAG: hypothetical protein PVH16_06330 [Thioalkalispiraceae bacterium]|jgi:hypothetical protein